MMDVRKSSATSLSSPVIICGDMNAHHVLWGSPYIDRCGIEIHETLAVLPLVILNTGKFTRLNRPPYPNTCPDVTFASPNFAPYLTWDTIGDTMGSDHLPIILTIDAQLVVVLCDSRSDLESISGLSSPPSHPLRVQLLEECASLRDRSYELGYQWIPSHVLIMAVQQGPVICGGPVYNVNMAEKASKPSPTIGVKPVPMRLFATLDVDKTPPNCISSSESGTNRQSSDVQPGTSSECSTNRQLSDAQPGTSSENCTNRQLSDAQRARVLAARCAVHYSYTKGVLVPTVF
uniref:Endonuclease/exonuclease/phosphatase domain-containing protein n=1 Tax=Timema tahoe TaxID=61484 RepID=A0A7R9FMA3_9NEOP|nr:unnamed protein product [Timema tahoe]